MFRYRRSIKCDVCNEKDSIPEFHTSTMGYYRNKTSSTHFFCGEDCRDVFQRLYICNKCHYTSNLVQVEENGRTISLCTDYAHDPSCFDRHNSLLSGCAICHESILNLGRHRHQDMEVVYDTYNIMYLCNDCHENIESYLASNGTCHVCKNDAELEKGLCGKCKDVVDKYVSTRN